MMNDFERSVQILRAAPPAWCPEFKSESEDTYHPPNETEKYIEYFKSEQNRRPTARNRNPAFESQYTNSRTARYYRHTFGKIEHPQEDPDYGPWLIEMARICVPWGSIGYLENLHQFLQETWPCEVLHTVAGKDAWGLPYTSNPAIENFGRWYLRLSPFQGQQPQRVNINLNTASITDPGHLLPGIPYSDLPTIEHLWQMPQAQNNPFDSVIPGGYMLRLFYWQGSPEVTVDDSDMDLVAGWNLTDVATATIPDASGNGNDLTIVGTSNYEGTLIGDGRNFPGVDGYLDANALDAFPNGAPFWTLLVWYRSSTLDVINTTIMGWLNAQNNSLVVDPGGNVIFTVETGGGVDFARSDEALVDGGFHQLGAVFDTTLSSNNIKLYIDGQLQAMSPTLPGASFSTDPFNIAASNNGLGADFLTANLVAPRIYSTAKSYQWIRAKFNAETPLMSRIAVDGVLRAKSQNEYQLAAAFNARTTR